MSDSSSHEELIALLQGVTEHGLTDDERLRLAALLADSPERRALYVEYCQMHAMLQFEHGVLAASNPQDAILGDRPQRFSNASRRGAGAAFAAAAAILLYFFVGRQSPPGDATPTPRRGQPVATLKTAVGVRFVYGPQGESTNAAGAPMPQGVYQLQQGLLELEYASGALLTVEAPAQFDLVNKQVFRLDSGRVSAHVPESAHGFKVDTAAATVVDLGTDFAVQASRDEPSEVHVFNGEVRVELRHGKGAAANPLRLLSGQATKIDRFTGLPAGIDLDDQRFLRGLDAKPQSYSRQILSLDPAVYYRMEPTGDGATLEDEVGKSDATIHVGDASRPAWAPGQIGASFELGGPAQQTYASAAAYPRTTSKQLSVVAWVYARSRPRWASIAKNWAGADDHGQFHFGLQDDIGALEAHLANRQGHEIAVRDKMPLPLNQWHHVAFVADGTMLRLYRAGVEIDAIPYDDLVGDPSIRALAIGTKLNLEGNAPEEFDFNMWDGRLDELAIFNHALSPDSIRRLYELGSEGSKLPEKQTAAAENGRW